MPSDPSVALDPVRVGVIGHGYATRTFHAPLLRAVPGVELAAICSRSPAEVRAALPGVAVVTTPKDLLALPELEVVVVAAPNALHAPLAEQALHAGKHVVVDKPFTLAAAEASRLVELARRKSLLLSVFHNRRWDADFLTLRRVLTAGELGRVVHFESHFDRHRPSVRRRWRELPGPGAGLWYDLGPHLVDQAVQLFGMPQGIWLDTARQRDHSHTDDWFHAVLRYRALRVVLHGALVAARPAPRFVVQGLRGTLVKEGVDPQEQLLRSGEAPGGPNWGKDPQPFQLTLAEQGQVAPVVSPVVSPARPLVAELGDYRTYYAALREAVRGRGPNPVPTEQALQVMHLLDLGRSSAEDRREREVRAFGR